MSKKDENRKHVRKRKAEKESDSDYSDLEEGSRRGYDDSRGRPRYNRDYYNYSAYGDRYGGWQDLYRPDYHRDGYRSDYDWGYQPYRGRRYNDDYYDDYGYGGDSDCFACNQRGGRRGGRMYEDSSFIYSYEESRPRRRYEDRSRHRSRRTAGTDRDRNRNDVSVYAVHDTAGHSGFKDKNRDKPEPDKSEVMSDSDHETPHRRRHSRRERRYEERRRPRKRRPEYYDTDC